jgi:hypothetical protein
MLWVYLVDPLVAIGDPAKYREILIALQGHFDRVAPRLNPPDRIRVAFIPATPAPTTSDILIYFAPSEYSFVSEFAGRKHDPLLDDGDGWTVIKPGNPPEAASEVYTKTLDAQLLAALAFHEAMHNKLAMGNSMHKGDGLAQATVTPSTTVSPTNAGNMAAAFRKPVKQWPDGIKSGLARRSRRDSGDPLWNL